MVENNFRKNFFENNPITQIGFPIFNITQNKYEGTGFIFTPDGQFLSAGHNFNTKNSYEALFKDKLYEIKTLKHEYSKKEGKDLFIGQLIDFKETIEVPFSIISPEQDDTIDWNKLNLFGYNSFNKNSLPITVKNPEVTLYPQVFTTKKLTEEDGNIKFISDLIKVDSKRIEKEEFIPLYFRSRDYVNLKGLSGGPVYQEDKIYGIIIGDCFLSGEYILKAIESLKGKQNEK